MAQESAAITLSLDDQISRTIPATQRWFFDPPDLSRSLLAAREPGTHVKSDCGETVEGEAIVGRIIGQWLSARLGQQCVVDNRPGAGSNIGTEAVVHAPADGYTLLMVGSSSAINATLYGNLKFNFIRDTVPVASINRIPHVLEAHPSFLPRPFPS